MDSFSSCRDLNLLELVIRNRWCSVERRTLLYPAEIELEKDGLTTLHWACCNNVPARTLRVLLQQHSLEPQRRYDDEVTPLMLYLGVNEPFWSVDCVRAFCEESPTHALMAKGRDTGETVLHFVVCCETVGQDVQENIEQVVSILLQAAPKLATSRNIDGITPLDLLFRHHIVNNTNRSNDDECHFWAIAELILAAATAKQDNFVAGGSLLHRLVSFPIHEGLLEYAMTGLGSMMDVVDDEGNTPLHRAITLKREPSIWIVLLKKCPSWAKRRNRLVGHLPIWYAFSIPWNEGHEALLRCHPCLNDDKEENVPDCLYPHILAKPKSIQTIYSILCTKPDLIPNQRK